MTRLVLTGGPFDGVEIAQLPPDTAAPVQVVWSGWSPQGFTAWLYEWHGEEMSVGGYTAALIYRPTGRRIPADMIPPVIADAADDWSNAALLISQVFDVPAELLWPL